MNDKIPTITYIKNGNEKIVKLNLLNINTIKKEIFNSNDWGVLTLKSNIEYIYFKNINFPLFTIHEDKFCGISSNYNTICVIENCDLKNKINNKEKRIELTGGMFELINIDSNELESFIEFNSYKEILIDNTNLTNCTHNLSIDSYTGFQKINIKDNNTIKKIYLSVEDASLYGNFLLEDLTLIADNVVKIGSTNKETKIILTSNRQPYTSIGANELELNNCSIINNTTANIYINYKKIIGNNFIIKSKGNIIINHKVVLSEKNKDGYVELTIKDLLRLKLNNILTKKIRQIEEQIDLKTKQELIEKPNQKLETNIKYQEQIVKYNTELLKELKEELVNWNDNKRKNLTKSLKNRSVRDYS